MSRLPVPSLHRQRPGVRAAGFVLAVCWLPCIATSQVAFDFGPDRDGVRLTDPLHQFHSPHPVPISSTQRLPIGLISVEADEYQTSRLNGARLAIDQANRERQAADVEFALITAGIDGPWQTAAGKARDLLFQSECLALISPSDGDTSHLIVQLAARCHVPVICLSETSTLTRVPVPWLFRMVPDARQQIEALLASIALPRGGSVTTLIPAGRAGRTVRQDLETLARDGSISFRPLIEVDPAHPDAANVAGLAQGPVLLFLDPPSLRAVLSRLNRSGFQGPVLVPCDRLDDTFEIQPAPGIALHTIRLFDPASAGTDAFQKAYRQAYGMEPDEAAACAYDATQLLVRAILNAGPDRSSIREWLAGSRHERGLTGEIAFDGTGNRSALNSFIPSDRQAIDRTADRNPQYPTSDPKNGTPLEEGQSP